MFNELTKILMTWAMSNQEYEMVYYLFTEFNTGIPAKLMYKLPRKHMFRSLEEFRSLSNSIQIEDPFLRKILSRIVRAKYQRLKNFDNLYGYKLH